MLNLPKSNTSITKQPSLQGGETAAEQSKSKRVGYLNLEGLLNDYLKTPTL